MSHDARYIILAPLLTLIIVPLGILWMCAVFIGAVIANAFSINKHKQVPWKQQ